MRVAVDSSVLLAIFKGEEGAEAWLDLLIDLAPKGELCICEIVAAEVGGFFDTLSAFDRAIEKLGVTLRPSQLPACHYAGRVFQQYRRKGGVRTHPIPDFLIASHALLQADLLAASDRGYFGAYFSDLKVVTPNSLGGDAR